MGRFFSTFDEAWQFFLARDEPLESFFTDFPEGESYVLVWLLGFDAALVPWVRAAQRAFSAHAWITPQPAHFLHTSIAAVSVCTRRPTDAEIGVAVERARNAWSSVRIFDVEYRRVNCFHDAVVVEVTGSGPHLLASQLVSAGYWNALPIDGAAAGVDPDVFLPHVTIGLIDEPTDASSLRDTLVPIRETRIGAQTIRDVRLCVVPASRTTILKPWDVVGRVPFDS